ncbi:MAG: SDR family oxidoreductase [Halieaceae bacterium]|jgi:NAD(P)-dependent dehydrogenase (short-subunit alcohol dehydrogenase family)|nr:SDR family oxidoreductase [Halieaceae bacterium]
MANILITGATAGIGRAAAVLLHSKGHRVFAAGRNRDALDALERDNPGISALELDVTDGKSVNTAAEQIAEALGGQPLDVLVNNAGYALVGPLEEIPDEDWERQYQTNVLGLVRVTRAFLPGMRQRRRGRIVNVSSVAGRVTVPFFAPYNSTKHALESISDSLRHELRPHGIEVVVIEPGAVKTRFGSLERDQIDAFIEAGSPYSGQLETLRAFHEDLHAKGADPVTVAGAIVQACEDNNPNPRRVVPAFPGSAFIAIKAWLPTRLADWIVRRLTGLP